MSPISTRSRALAVGVLCAAGGVGAGAVASATASSGSTPQTTAHHAKAHGHKGKHPRLHELRSLARHSAQGSVVVHTKAGFKTISFEHGVVDSVNGDQLTLTEGGAKHAYKKVTITVPSTVLVRDNGKKSAMSSVTAGQHVTVMQLPKHTIVRAHTPKHAAA